MNTDQKQKNYDKQLKKVANLAYALLLAIFAVILGTQAGNIWYKLDANVADDIDTEYFKDAIGLSFPLMEIVYNSGKSSVSFAGEVKELFSRVFDFSLDSPATIFNAQSPVFMSYYMMQAQKQSLNDPSPDNNGAEGGNNGQNSTAKSGVGNNEGGTDGTGNGMGNEARSGNGEGKYTENNGDGRTEKGLVDGSTESSMSMGTEYSSAGGSGQGSNSSGQGSVHKGDHQQVDPGDPYAVPVQPISSIAYEIEDEDEDDETDTVEIDKIAIKNFTSHKIDVAKLLKEPLNIDLSGKGPKVLIYHTHTSESYVLKESDLGKKNVPSFNSNPKYSVVRVGEELARHLKKYGIDTIHNGTVHDKVRESAYSVSINTLQSYKKSYPSIQVYIDVHRDAVDDKKPKLRMTKEINGKNCAQIMFVVGADGILPHPEWLENLKFVLKLQQKLNEKYPGLARHVWVVGKRYNQQISNNAILIEVGGDGNLLSECIESTKYLAEVLNEVMKDE